MCVHVLLQFTALTAIRVQCTTRVQYTIRVQCTTRVQYTIRVQAIPDQVCSRVNVQMAAAALIIAMVIKIISTILGAFVSVSVSGVLLPDLLLRRKKTTTRLLLLLLLPLLLLLLLLRKVPQHDRWWWWCKPESCGDTSTALIIY